jgi:type III restriction enzyme
LSDNELFPFQAKASEQIATRYGKLALDDRRPMVNRFWDVPFYQALSALTGSGKTPMLADTVSQIRAQMPEEPIVLWISKAKAVVDQTYANFEPGGKYKHLIPDFLICYLSELGPQQIADGTTASLVMATVGTFNQRDRADGTLRIHQTPEDKSDDSIWKVLTERKTSTGVRRPLVIVYDEGHNLSDQQTELLLDLEPNVILVASATMRTPARLARLIDRLREHGWSDDELVTSIPSKKVVKAGLVKQQIVLGGYATSMEEALDGLLSDMNDATEKAEQLDLNFRPKAIYVCRTNISQEDGLADSPARPFAERKAPPILIWRYLVEQKGVDPADIAVYCDLRFDRKHNAPPKDFILFSGGDEDFSAFTSGNYHHIIFNLGLQEGWDDPACGFAYIDKSMGSTVQVEQVIGRALRQPGAKHYPEPLLNTAYFYIRVDNKSVFPTILETVRKKIAAEIPEVKLEGFTDSRDRQRTRLEPKQVLKIPEIHINSDDALVPLQEVIKMISDYRVDAVNTVGKGELVRATQVIGDGSKATIVIRETSHANRVLARWILRRGIQSLYPEVVKTIDWSDPKFDARMEITSAGAATLRERAEALVDTYLVNSDLAFEEDNPFVVGAVIVNPAKVENFENALHDGYSDLSPYELPFARAIDALGVLWLRNPSNGGFSIPLLQKGDSRNFYPDFLVMKDGVIFAIDPKGAHLIGKDAGLKLLDIRDEKGARRVIVRLITEGKWTDPKIQTNPEGYTVWSMSRTGKPKPKHCATVEDAIAMSLKP